MIINKKLSLNKQIFSDFCLLIDKYFKKNKSELLILKKIKKNISCLFTLNKFLNSCCSITISQKEEKFCVLLSFNKKDKKNVSDFVKNLISEYNQILELNFTFT